MIRVLLVLIIILSSCNENKKSSNQLRGEAFGTYYYITSADDKDLDDIRPSIDNLVDSINESMSTYKRSSIISNLNRKKSHDVDEMFMTVFNRSKSIYEDTNGYFDPTIGVLVNHYGFGSEKKSSSDVGLDSLKKLVGFNKLSKEGNTIIKKFPQIHLDFNSIAKGFAVDKFADHLTHNGYKDFLIDIGGEIYARGKKNKDQLWTIGVDKPSKKNNTSTRKLSTKIGLQNKAMATSGNYRKYKVDSKTGKETVHTINPITGKAEPSDILSASIVAEDCMTADAYATAFMAMGQQKTMDFLDTNTYLDAFIIYRSNNGIEKTYVTKGFEQLMID